jgi:hypothetical protein
MRELCYALGISETIELAEKYLDVARTKEFRADGNPGTKPGSGARDALQDDRYWDEVLRKDKFWNFLQHQLRVDIPEKLYDPVCLAAVVTDAGLQLSGRQVLRLAQHLFHCYHLLIVGDPEAPVEIPKMLNIRPDDEGFDKFAQILDNVLRYYQGDPEFSEPL